MVNTQRALKLVEYTIKREGRSDFNCLYHVGDIHYYRHTDSLGLTLRSKVSLEDYAKSIGEDVTNQIMREFVQKSNFDIVRKDK